MSGIGVVSVHYYDDYLRRSMAAASDIAARVDASLCIFVANRPELLPGLRHGERRMNKQRIEIELHSNEGMEFGAYEAGLTRLLDADLDWVVFTNDTFSIHGHFSSVYRNHFLAELARPADRTVPHAVGQVESSPRSFAIEGKRTHRWLTTSIFALNKPALEALGNRLYFPEIDALIRPASDPDEFFSPRLDHVLAEHIRWWLFEPSCDVWYGAAPLSVTNASRFANKARAILQEKYISAILEEASARFSDVKTSYFRERMLMRFEAMLFSNRLLTGKPTRARTSKPSA